jgi:hypothetical protein
MESTIPKNPIPGSLQILLADLDFLSQIGRKMKPCCDNRVLVDAESWSGALYRLYKGENRLGVITKVEQIINSAVEAIENQKYSEHLSLTINSLYNSYHGLNNLLNTYESDPNMKARINVQLKNIDIQLERYRHLIKGFRPGDMPEKRRDDIPEKRRDDIPEKRRDDVLEKRREDIPEKRKEEVLEKKREEVPEKKELENKKEEKREVPIKIELMDSESDLNDSIEKKVLKKPFKFKKPIEKEL